MVGGGLLDRAQVHLVVARAARTAHDLGGSTPPATTCAANSSSPRWETRQPAPVGARFLLRGLGTALIDSRTMVLKAQMAMS